MLLIEQTTGVHAASRTNKTKKEYKNKGTHSTKSKQRRGKQKRVLLTSGKQSKRDCFLLLMRGKQSKRDC